MTKKTQRDNKVESSHPRVRISGEKGSVQNKLRYELYKKGIERIEECLESEHYIECTAIIDSMITDRLMAYVQSLLHNEPHQYIANSLFDALKSFGSATKEKNKRDRFYARRRKAAYFSR